MTAAISSATTSNQTGTTAINSDLSNMAGEEFMALLLAQLRNQNPLEPMDDQQLLNQVTQLTSMQELQSINQTLSGMADSSSMLDGAALIGRAVRAQMGGDIYEGIVTGVSMLDDSATLWLNDLQVPLENVLQVFMVEEAYE
ncbi:MAG: hypothetical protein JXA97_07275 [Anaerolineales bacterium]|nr:hypothetical protein [Anaerolineales bacterium]